MKTIISIGVLCLLFAGAVYANNCTTTRVVTPDGKIILCQTCCFQGQCTTTCY